MKKDKWTLSTMSVWVVLTLLIPVGLIVGPLNLKHDERKKQAVSLLVLGFVSVALWIIHFAGMHQ